MHATGYLSALRRLYAANGEELLLRPAASAAELDTAQRQMPFTLDAELRALWQIANGSATEQPVFARPGFLTGYAFLPVAAASEMRESLRKRSPGYAEYQDPQPRDERIQPGWFQEGWLPFASFGGGTLLLILDHSPSGAGQAGQIIAFSHDPDELSYVAASLPALLEASLASITEDVEEFLSRGE